MLLFMVLAMLAASSLRWGRQSKVYALISLMGSVFWIGIATFEELILPGTGIVRLYGDQHWFVMTALSIPNTGSFVPVDDLRYTFYPLFLYLSAPGLGYIRKR